MLREQEGDGDSAPVFLAGVCRCAGSRGLAGPSDHIASLRHQAQCRQRPERKRGRSSAYIAEKAIFKGALLFLRPVHRVETVAPFLLTSFSDERSKACGGMLLKNTARNFKKSFRFLFGRSKRNIDNGWMPFVLLPAAPFLFTSFGDERSKACGGMPLKPHLLRRARIRTQMLFRIGGWAAGKQHSR